MYLSAVDSVCMEWGGGRRRFQPSLFKQGPGQWDRVATLPTLLAFSPQTRFFFFLQKKERKKSHPNRPEGRCCCSLHHPGPLVPSVSHGAGRHVVTIFACVAGSGGGGVSSSLLEH